MDKTEAVDEILEFAISRELQANQFYMALSRRAEDPEMQKVFEQVAAEELEHKAKLELERIKRGYVVKPNNVEPPPDNEFIKSDTDTLLDIDYKDLILLSIEKEDASFRTYVTLLGTLHDEESRDAILAIAEEEIKHKLRWEYEYEALMKGQIGDKQ